MKSIIKLYRFFLMYGLERTIVKTASRAKIFYFKYLIWNFLLPRKKATISLIGCGQFGFATISYFLLKSKGKVFLNCFDVNEKRSTFTAQFYQYQAVTDIDDVFNNSNVKLVYVASNHSTHTLYAIECLKRNIDIYIEKPIAVNKDQLKLLLDYKNKSSARIYVGYNRPFSKAIILLRKKIFNNLQPISLNCYISGHLIENTHWYRNPEEGTRICGNVGHWIDLMINLMAARGEIPQQFETTINYANIDEIDDNISITITTEFNDICSIFISSRSEPFEGINETINLQCGDIIAKIDDFKSITIWDKHTKISKKYLRKDVGHKKAINQPFSNQSRDWKEIEISTSIMLEITEMVLQNMKHKIIKL